MLPSRSDGPVGHLRFILSSEAASVEALFLNNYGSVVRTKAPFAVCQGRISQLFLFLLTFTDAQEDRLWVADPKALHHIFQATSYLYQKPAHLLEINSIVTDHGLLATQGEDKLPCQSFFFQLILSPGADHRRQRKAMMPAFGLTASRELLPRFTEVVDKVTQVSTIEPDLG